jgi:thiol:disulfide interchange protein
LTPEQKAMLAKVTERLKAESDPAKLEAALQKIEEQGAQAPPDAKAFMAVYKKKIEERLAELKSEKK